MPAVFAASNRGNVFGTERSCAPDIECRRNLIDTRIWYKRDVSETLAAGRYNRAGRGSASE
ncbi:hypothetical protein DN523_19720 [Burkholderia multivorans]|nr:hypothetical protein DN470_12065 [Burkholderia multivorans]RAA27988.1 hypothetical protein DN465_26755 [Burkholderia multivorans]RAA29539.1 hypothetical protein DN471_09020 [Burkholderia multivorans]RAA45636.1 hypothetical protein DN472_12505 [Burkholderia multivorans]RAA49204.1 hypothetical protein DN500_05900 [Burkholderia multivorans]